MRYAFILYFSFEDDTVASFAFTVVEPALKALGISHPSFDGPGYGDHLDWMGTVASKFEEKFNSVHDATGTVEGDTLLDGYCLYETGTFDEAREIAQCWREAFADHIGSEEGLSDLLCFDGQDAETVDRMNGQQVMVYLEKAVANQDTCEARHPSRLSR